MTSQNLPQWNVNWHTFELIYVWQDKSRQDPTFVGDCRAGLGDSCGISCLFWFWFLRITDYKIKINSQEKVYSLVLHALLSLQCKKNKTKKTFRSTAGERRISLPEHSVSETLVCQKPVSETQLNLHHGKWCQILSLKVLDAHSD